MNYCYEGVVCIFMILRKYVVLMLVLLVADVFPVFAGDVYVNNGDGTITDTKTQLMWKQCSEGQQGKACSGGATKYTWDDAMSTFGKGISFARYDDWRLPTHEELRTLVWCSNGTPQKEAWEDWCEGKDSKAREYQQPTIDLKVFPNTDSWFYWSSTAKDVSFAWLVYFDSGYDNWNGCGYEGAVRLVRSGI